MIPINVVRILVFHFRITKERDVSNTAVLKFSPRKVCYHYRKQGKTNIAR